MLRKAYFRGKPGDGPYTISAARRGTKFESSYELSNECIGAESVTDATISRSLALSAWRLK